MSSRGAAARDDEVARPAPRPRPRPRVVRSSARRRRQVRIRFGLLTIPLIALLFAGVVFINSKELSLVKRQGEVVRQTARVQEQLAQLNAKQEKADVTVRTRAEAMGMVNPSTDSIQYITARPETPTP